MCFMINWQPERQQKLLEQALSEISAEQNEPVYQTPNNTIQHQ